MPENFPSSVDGRPTLFAFLWVALVLWAVPIVAQPIVVIPFGDSITYGLGDGITTCRPSPRGYPPRLQAHLAAQGLATEMRIRAVCGEETPNGITRLRTLLENDLDARLVLIMEGTNDLSTSLISTETARDNIGFMIDAAREVGVRPVVASVIPRAPEGGSNYDTAIFNDLLRVLTTEKDVEFVNQYQLVNMDDLYDRFYWNPLHPNAQGYDLVADLWIEPTLATALRPIDPCLPDDQTLCLKDERFQVEIEWRDFAGNTGIGQAVPLTSDTGYFWFFDESNIEVVVKALDGQELNGYYWFFYGALSTVEYTLTVTDTETGRRQKYSNALNTLASDGDTAAFAGDPPDEADGSAGPPTGSTPRHAKRVGPSSLEAFEAPPVLNKRVVRPADPERLLQTTCEETEEVMCLLQDRFAVKIRWQDFAMSTGTGKGVKLTSDSGYFWFFTETNVEVMVKVLDGRETNGNYWVFYGALSNVEYEIEVMDTETGEVVIYSNPSMNFGSRADTSAFEGS